MENYGIYPDLSRIKRILVIKLRHHGDVLLTSPLFRVLKSRLTDVEIYALIYKPTLPMLEGHPAIAGFHLYDRKWKELSFWKKASREISLIRQIREKKYDLVINLTEGDRGAFVAKLSKAWLRLGVKPTEQSKFKKSLYTHMVKDCKKPRHMVEQNLDAARKLGIFPPYEKRELSLHIPHSDCQIATSYLQEAGISDNSFILLHPTSSWTFKCWPPEKVARLMGLLHETGLPLVLTSSPDASELAMLTRIISMAPDIPMLNLGGKLTLKQLDVLIRSCACLVCVDSLPMHMASTFKKPAVAIFGPTNDQTWGQWQNPHGRVLFTPVSCRPCNLDGCGGGKVCDCLEQLPVDVVYQTIKELLSKVQG